jgi:hypothetical protein
VPVRFEVSAAFCVGVLLPVLETVRRGFGHWAIEATTMLEDYLAGGLLVAAGLAAWREATFAKPLLLAVWAGVAAMMSISLVSQIEDTIRAVELEPNNSIVLLFKVLLWVTCISALLRSFRQVQRSGA